MTTVEELEVKHWLNRAFYAEKKARALEMLVQQCRERAQGLSQSWEGKDTGKADGSENGTENALMKLADMERKAEAQKVEAVNASAEIQDAISQLNNFDLESVLIHRYLLFHTDKETAEIMNYDERTIRRKREKAIRKLSGYVLECPAHNMI